VAFRPPHLHAADAASLCARLLHEKLIRLYDHPYEAVAWLPTARTEEEVRDLLHYYTTTLTYVGSKARGVRIRQALKREAGRLRPGDARDLTTEFLSGDSSLATIAETVRRIEAPPDWTEEGYLDATVATNVISHGVDVERFNLMIMDSIPEETADYIQASSRSGRRHVGLVLAVLPSYSLRASSIYHRFKKYHEHLERLVSPVSVNRFAKYAASRTAPGILVGLLLGRYGPLGRTTRFVQRNLAAELLTPTLPSTLRFRVDPTGFRRDVEAAYALDQDIYPSGLELAMRHVLEEQVERFLYNVRGSRQDKVLDVVQPKPMTSLRDVDVGVQFRPDEELNWQELQWFNTHDS
jgi:Helicase conserved C-terminal domain